MALSNAEVLEHVRTAVHSSLTEKHAGHHDWQHIQRVVRLALRIARGESYHRCRIPRRHHRPDLFVIELAALLHDVGDWKFADDSDKGARIVRELLEALEIPEQIIDEVIFIGVNISFKGGTNRVKMRTLEGRIVQDADLLDGIGAIGIGRTFAYGGSINRPMHDPDVELQAYATAEEYAERHRASTLDYFEVKLRHVPELMNTRTGRRLARRRHAFTMMFRARFLAEWEGRR